MIIVIIELAVLALLSKLFLGSAWLSGVVGFIAVLTIYNLFCDLMLKRDIFDSCWTMQERVLHSLNWPEFMESKLHPDYAEQVQENVITGLSIHLFSGPHKCEPQVVYSNDGRYKVTIYHESWKNYGHYQTHNYRFHYERA